MQICSHRQAPSKVFLDSLYSLISPPQPSTHVSGPHDHVILSHRASCTFASRTGYKTSHRLCPSAAAGSQYGGIFAAGPRPVHVDRRPREIHRFLLRHKVCALLAKRRFPTDCLGRVSADMPLPLTIQLSTENLQLSQPKDSSLLTLAQTCSQLRYESLPIFFRNNSFVLHIDNTRTKDYACGSGPTGRAGNSKRNDAFYRMGTAAELSCACGS